MKRNKYSPFTIITTTLALITLMACETMLDDFEYEKKSPKLVVNAILNPDNVLQIHISSSKTYNPPGSLKLIENASVELFEDNQSMGQLSSMGNGYYTLSDTYPQAGLTYKVVATAEGYETVWAETTIPDKIENFEIDQKVQITYQNGYPSTMMAYLLTLEVPSRKSVFFGTSISSQRPDHYNVQKCVERETPYYNGEYYETDSCYWVEPDSLATRTQVLSIYSNSSLIKFTKDWQYYRMASFDDNYQMDKIYFSNQNYSGTSLSLILRMDYYQLFGNINNEIAIWTDSFDEVLFKFMYSMAKKFEVDDNPLAEKVSVYTNVNGGLGIFGSCTSTGYTYQYDDEFLERLTPKN